MPFGIYGIELSEGEIICYNVQKDQQLQLAFKE